jgi:hypothetical protein
MTNSVIFFYLGLLFRLTLVRIMYNGDMMFLRIRLGSFPISCRYRSDDHLGMRFGGIDQSGGAFEG